MNIGTIWFNKDSVTKICNENSMKLIVKLKQANS